MIEKQHWTYVSKPGPIVQDAHDSESDITSLCFARNGHTLLSRAMDHTLKVWDIRSLKSPYRVFTGLTNTHDCTGCCFSPTETIVLTGVSDDGNGTGGLAFLDVNTGEVVRKVPMDGSVVPVLWHPRLNQIFAGTGMSAMICLSWCVCWLWMTCLLQFPCLVAL